MVEPLIPENTGNIARTCVGTNSELHLVRPLGFEITESRVKRAGLDYWDHLSLSFHQDFNTWLHQIQNPERIFYIETDAPRCIFDAAFQPGDWIVFGKETSGLNRELIPNYDAHAWSFPMPGPVRSLNLSNCVAATVFEVMRQTRNWARSK